jgi:hypothetical protein
MSKIKKKDLTRGTKLTPEAIWDNNLDDVALNLSRANNGDGLIQPMYQAGTSTFRLNWNIPWIGSEWTFKNGILKPYVIPFCLLPLQEFITANAVKDEDLPQLFMTEFSFGFDQRGEPAFITDPNCGAGTANPDNTWSQYIRSVIGGAASTSDFDGYFTNNNHGKLHYDLGGRGNLKFSILKKEMQFFNSTASSEPTDNIYDLDVPLTNFIGEHFNNNPAVETGLNIEIDPYATYCLGITPPQLYDSDATASTTNDNLAMVNLTISVKFEMRMLDRDVTIVDNILANQPTHAGAKNNDTVTLTSPLAASTIEADTPDGVNTSTSTLDEKFRKKLKSGYNSVSEPPTVEQLTQDSGYEIIAIPVWNNQFDNTVTAKSAFMAQQAYCYGYQGDPTPGKGTTYQPMSTRVIVPINYPFTIHHVVLAANVYTAAFYTQTDEFYMSNWQGHQNPTPANAIDTGTTPLSPIADDKRFKHDIGIAVGTGLRGSRYGYRQILNYANFDPFDNDLHLDDIRMNYPCTTSAFDNQGGSNFTIGNPLFPGVEQPDFEWRTFYLPLNSSGFANPDLDLAPGLYNGITGTKATPTAFTDLQDPPFFLGQDYATAGGSVQTNPPTVDSLSGTALRFDDIATSANKRLGSDQWIEVRWNVHPRQNAGANVPWLQYQGGGLGVGDANESKIIHGYGGHWIYLIGKKTAVSNANWKDTNLDGPMVKEPTT